MYPHTMAGLIACYIAAIPFAINMLAGNLFYAAALFGGGELFRSLLAAGLVHRIEMSLIPVLLGGGIPLLPSPALRAKLKLRKQRFYEKTGTIGLEYDILPNT